MSFQQNFLNLLIKHRYQIDKLIDYLDPPEIGDYLPSRISAKLLCNYLAPCGKRITTYELILPRFTLAQLNTHKRLSRNAASSRAIPGKKFAAKAENEPFFPLKWGKNQKGMEAFEELPQEIHPRLERAWNRGRKYILEMTKELNELGLHKEIANRPLEWCIYQTAIVTMTEDENFFNLRYHHSSQPELQNVAKLMYECREDQKPEEVPVGFWSRPLLFDLDDLIREGYSELELNKISSGRCARVSYLTHNGIRDPKADIELHDRMIIEGHYSPFEHPARAMEKSLPSGNFIGWEQYRKMIPGEEVFQPKSLL